MKIKRANKLPETQGFYWYMQDGALRLVQVESMPYLPLRWYLVATTPYSASIHGITRGNVDETHPEHWSEKVEFE